MSTLEKYLESVQYDEEVQLIGTILKSPGYHTRVPDGTYVHQTRGNATYAVALLASGIPENYKSAEIVLRKILDLQDTDPMSPTYGIWSWLVEEPLSEMDPPDWNWADFIGATFCHIVIEYADRVPAGLLDDIKLSINHAAYSIFRRNVQPAYTNIALKGATVTTVAGEILDEPQLLRYGRRRWERIIEHYITDPVGSSEYNSPTYGLEAMREVERLLQLAKDPVAREHAETIRRWVWETIAEHYHPGTQQWSGPHGRAYSEYLDEGYAAYISEQADVEIDVHPNARTGEGWSEIKHLPCPDDLKPRFQALPESDYEIDRLYIRRDDEFYSQRAKTWFSEEATLGTATRDITWVQRHHLIGYWRTPEDSAVVLGYEFLKNGRAFSSGVVTHQQQGSRVLSMLTLAGNLGDYHFSLNRPERSVYEAEDLRVRYYLRGKGVKVVQDGDNRFILSAGDWRAVLHTVPAMFAGQPVVWETGQEEGRVFVDAVCYHGENQAFDLINIGADSYVPAGLELIPSDTPIMDTPPEISLTDELIDLKWGDLEIKMPRGAAILPI